MRSKLSINRQKVKATTSISNLQAEMERNEDTAKFWDKKGRQIDTSKTSENVVLQELPKYIDQYRKGLIQKMNQERANLSDGSKATRARSRALRSDTVDLITSVVQPSSEFISELPRAVQNEFFKDCLEVMRADEETYGRVLGAVIHYDENTPHMQVVCSTLDFQALKSRGNEIMGNQSKMSKDQTAFVEAVQSKGWEVERGIQRVDNPEYQNWADEKRAQGYDVNRYTDEAMMEADLKASEIQTEAVKKVQRQSEKMAHVIWEESWKKAKETGIVKDDELNPIVNGRMVWLNDRVARMEKWGLETVSKVLSKVWNYIAQKIKELTHQNKKEKAEFESEKAQAKSEMLEIAPNFDVTAQKEDSLINITRKISGGLERKSELLTSKEQKLNARELEIDNQEINSIAKMKRIADEASKKIQDSMADAGLSREDEPVYYYEGKAEPEYLGTVSELIDLSREDFESEYLGNELESYNNFKTRERNLGWSKNVWVNPSFSELQNTNLFRFHFEDINQYIESFDVSLGEIAHEAQKEIKRTYQNMTFAEKLEKAKEEQRRQLKERGAEKSWREDLDGPTMSM